MCMPKYWENNKEVNEFFCFFKTLYMSKEDAFKQIYEKLKKKNQNIWSGVFQSSQN